jgi:hypothetical protein
MENEATVKTDNCKSVREYEALYMAYYFQVRSIEPKEVEID